MGNKYAIICLALSLFLPISCEQKALEMPKPSVAVSNDLIDIVASDTLRIATLYGSGSYFLFRDELMGYDYEMAESLAKRLNVNLKISVAQTESEMVDLLSERKVDIISYNVYETKELKRQFNYTLPHPESFQVLVQNTGKDALSDVTQLAGKDIYVHANSIFHQRLEALNKEIGGTIHIVIAPDSLTNDDLIEMVANHKIKYTLAYQNVAALHKAYQKRLNCRLALGFIQKNGWLVRKGSPELYKYIENWEKIPKTIRKQSILFSKYWEKNPYFASRKVKIPKGSISPFDHLFKKYAALIGWDWRLLAALAFHESGFDSSEIAWSGASGLMQLMPRTAALFGLDRNTILNPEMNIEAGVQYIKSLNMTFRHVKSKDERIKFILAGYNSGPAHILDAMALADKYGKNPNIWYDHVEYFLLKKNEPEFYQDPAVKYGSFSGKETARYVQNTLDTYDKYIRRK